ncbi:MAG: heat-inducible transcription repressor HrcA [Deltaproteobacteria bacterium]|nr:MAG: heat-inducible transcription repressor HrcA [Deltaproteobacteria bacterium]
MLILREVVEAYIASGEAVGSKVVAQRLRNSLSPASIRSTMHSLGESGLLAKPHTSAGRVPTDRGYRAYLDALRRPAPLRPRDLDLASPLGDPGWDDGFSAQEVLRNAAHALSLHLGAISLIFAPPMESAVLQSIQLVWLGPRRVLAIAVTQGGVVHERLLRVEPELVREDLEGLSNYLNQLLPGRTLDEVRALIDAEQRRDRAAHSALEQQALEIGRRALGHVDDAPLVVDGAARLLETKEFAEAPDKAAELLRALEQRAAWLELLDRVADADDIEVYIGHENRRPALEPCALVAGRYDSDGGVGLVAVVGPKRLDYRRAIPLVRVVAHRLSTVLRSHGDELSATG